MNNITEQKINDVLIHFGIRGMHWGVHKKYHKQYMDTDRVIKKGFKIQNISADKERDTSRNTPVYGAYTEHDKNAYAGYYARSFGFWDKEAIKNTLVLQKNVKIPSQKKSVELFMSLYTKDPKGISDSVGRAYAELSYFNKIEKFRNWNSSRISKQLQTKGKEWMENKGYLLFNMSMMAEKESKARIKYFDLLLKHKYNAINDINDVQSGYNSDDPIIFINPKKTLKNVESKKLTINEIEIANARYEYDEALRNKGFLDLPIIGKTAEQKRNLKRVEKKYGTK